MPLDVAVWLSQICGRYTFDLGGVFRRRGEHEWPLTAANETDLHEQLASGGHLLPLPKEPAALANVLEVSVVDLLLKEAADAPGLEARRGTERGYPDIEISGPGLDGAFYAVDVKVARRAERARQPHTQSAITLYTGNTYFKHPDLRWPGTFRPFNEYVGHLDVISIYTLNVDHPARIEELELIVQEPWRIASRLRSSSTREYIGAVKSIAALRDGRGDFQSADAFYKYWRAFRFRESPQVRRQYQMLARRQQAELDALRERLTPEESDPAG